MDLSRNIIKRYVAVTTPEKVTSNSDTRYGTVVSEGSELFVMIDGSSILTPVSSTIDLKEGDRVLILVKNHEAIVLGSPTSPTARLEELRELEKGVTEFEVILADKVGTGELVAMQALIEQLEAKDVEITGNLTANNAKIEALEAENVTVNGKLDVYQADIEDLQAETAKIGSLEAGVAKIDKLEADFAVIKDLDVDKLEAEIAKLENLDATYATIENLEANYATIENLDAEKARITDLEADFAVIEDLDVDRLEANIAKIENLDATYATIESLEANYATIENLDAEKARITDLEATRLKADDAVIKNLQADVADIDTLIFGSASGGSIQTSFANAVIAQLGNAQIKSAMIDSLSADKITAGDILTNNVRVLSEDGKLLISDETIQISDDTRVRVQIGKDASNDYSVNVWDAAGKLMFSAGGITDAAIKSAIIRDDMVSDTANIKASKLDISSLFTEINESTETINSNKVLIDTDSGTLDVAFVKMESDINDISEEVSTQGTALSVVQGQISSKVWKSDVSTAQSGVTNISITNPTPEYYKLSGFHTFGYGQFVEFMLYSRAGESIKVVISSEDSSYKASAIRMSNTHTKIHAVYYLPSANAVYVRVAGWANNLGIRVLSNSNGSGNGTITKIESLPSDAIQIPIVENTDSSDIEPITSDITTLTTQYTELDQTVDGISATVAQHTTEISNKADSSEVTFVLDRVTKVETDLTGFRTNVSETYATKIDLSTVDTKAGNAQKAADDAQDAADKAQEDLGKLATRVTTAETSINQNAEQIALRATKSEITETLDGYYTKDETDAELLVVNNAISQKVSSSEFATYKTTVTNDISTAKSEAISSAASDATAKANAAEEAANEYTDGKVETVTKEVNTVKTTVAEHTTGLNSITSRVSSTEKSIETIDGNVSSLSTRMSTAEQKITDEAIISTVSSTYATKSELNTKISELNTSVTQNADAIELRATKTEVTEALGGYYTKDETDAELEIMSTAISQKVSSTEFSTYKTTVTNNISTAKSEAISAAASDATTKANNAKSSAISTAATDAATKANAAKEAAIETAAEDATAKANAAQEAAATDATTKANNAKSAAISAAATDATTKANNAKSEAISAAATDATNKANAAEEAANDYTDGQIETVTKEVNTVKSTVAEHTTSLDSITSRVASTEKSIETTNGNVTSLTTRMKAAEQKITDDAIISTVSSTISTAKSEAISAAASDATTKANNAKSEAISAASADATDKANAAEKAAKEAASAAQTTADNAAAAADAAQDTADGVKTDLTNNYYTKTETEGWAKSQIEVSSNAITQTVSETYSTKTELTNASGELSESIRQTRADVTSLSHKADGFTMEFTNVTKDITQLDEKIESEVKERSSYIEFKDGKIYLGKQVDEGEDDFKVVISNDKVQFLQNGLEVAYLSNRKLYITHAEITGDTGSFTIGNYLYQQRTNGNLGIRWIS